jgi:signal transduction histidine kinase
MKRKLFAKYNQINLLTTIGIFLVASIVFYFTVNYIQLNQIDNDLKIEEEEIQLYVKQYDKLPTTFTIDEQMIGFYPVNTPFTSRYFNRVDTVVEHDQSEDFRQLTFGIKAGNQWYRVMVSKSLKDTDQLVKSIFWIVTSTILLILLASFLINRFLLRRLWNPFYLTLARLNDFHIDKPDKIQFPGTDTEEFALMIETLERMTKQARLDYIGLKTFSENASHEIQTPIAIIQSKLDLMIQDQALTDKQGKILKTIYEAIKRLSKISSSLLLLAKIENRQYSTTTEIDLGVILQTRVSDFQELWLEKEISLIHDLKFFPIHMNKELADVLVNNLLSNATKHNYAGGVIEIKTSGWYFEVTNTSHSEELDGSQLYHRFYKPSGKQSDNGLGMSIIKQICDVSGLKVDYSFANGRHTFTITKTD